MKRTFLVILTVFAISLSAYSQDKITWTPMVHQSGMYYASDVVTSDGFGFGLGVHLLHESRLAGQADVNILWGNGNAITTRFAMGYEREGKWTPGIYLTFNMIWGQRIELLTETGDKPSMPAFVTGFRIVPLKFLTKSGYVSAMEFGYGLGPEKGKSIEISILSVGLKF